MDTNRTRINGMIHIITNLLKRKHKRVKIKKRCVGDEVGGNEDTAEIFKALLCYALKGLFDGFNLSLKLRLYHNTI